MDSYMRTRSVIVVPLVGVTITMPRLQQEDTFHITLFVVKVLHFRQRRPSKPDIYDMFRAHLQLPSSAVMYLSKFRIAGPNSRGYGFVFDCEEDAKKYEPPYKLKKMGVFVNTKKNETKHKNRAKKMPNASSQKI